MPTLREYRVPMPLTVEEFRIAQLYMYAKTQRELNKKRQEEGTTEGDGIESVKNEPFDFTEDRDYGNCPITKIPLPKGWKGQYTEKRYHVAGRIPSVVKAMFPEEAFVLTEVAWNAYPNLLTVVRNNWLDVENFRIVLRSTHVDDDRGDSDDPIKHSKSQLDMREIVHLDVRDAHQDETSKDCRPEYNLRKWRSEKLARGPLDPGWEKDAKPIMCVYKSVEVHFHYFGFQSIVESTVVNQLNSIVCATHAAAVGQADEWYGMTMDDIRKMEEENLGKGLDYTGEEEEDKGESAAASGGGAVE